MTFEGEMDFDFSSGEGTSSLFCCKNNFSCFKTHISNPDICVWVFMVQGLLVYAKLHWMIPWLVVKLVLRDSLCQSKDL